MHKYNKETVERLFRAILSLENLEECEKFFDDAFTIQEIESIAQRFDVACRLCEGKSYVQINAETGASTATICRVSKCLNYGDGGYKIAIDRTMNEEKNSD
jgi:TrpR-related protein YerC/YecD